MPDPSSQPTQPLTEEEEANVRANLARAGRSDAPWAVVPNHRAVSGLVAALDQLRGELAEMETDRDKYQNWYDNACDEVAEAYRSRNEED